MKKDLIQMILIGISYQRETFVVWDKEGKPLHNAIVWQCKRSVQICEQLKQKDFQATIQQKTGLVIDPYFSATKLFWLFQNKKVIKEALQTGRAFFGTIDTWLLYQLTNGKEYATDYTNPSRTLFFNLHSLKWETELINLFGFTGIKLPIIKASSSLFGNTTLNGLLPNSVSITALIGDSHAAGIYKDLAQLETFGEKRKQIEFYANKEKFRNYYEGWKAIIANGRF